MILKLFEGNFIHVFLLSLIPLFSSLYVSLTLTLLSLFLPWKCSHRHHCIEDREILLDSPPYSLPSDLSSCFDLFLNAIKKLEFYDSFDLLKIMVKTNNFCSIIDLKRGLENNTNQGDGYRTKSLSFVTKKIMR